MEPCGRRRSSGGENRRCSHRLHHFHMREYFFLGRDSRRRRLVMWWLAAGRHGRVRSRWQGSPRGRMDQVFPLRHRRRRFHLHRLFMTRLPSSPPPLSLSFSLMLSSFMLILRVSMTNRLDWHRISLRGTLESRQRAHRLRLHRVRRLGCGAGRLRGDVCPDRALCRQPSLVHARRNPQGRARPRQRCGHLSRPPNPWWRRWSVGAAACAAASASLMTFPLPKGIVRSRDVSRVRLLHDSSRARSCPLGDRLDGRHGEAQAGARRAMLLHTLLPTRAGAHRPCLLL